MNVMETKVYNDRTGWLMCLFCLPNKIKRVLKVFYVYVSRFFSRMTAGQGISDSLGQKKAFFKKISVVVTAKYGIVFSIVL